MTAETGVSRVAVGLEVIQTRLPDVLKGAKVGVVAHAASRLPNGEHALTVLQRCGVGVARLFGPEHGFFGMAAAGEGVEDAFHDGLPLVSLYGARRAPDLEHLNDLDALVVDLQDVGVRAYTYLATVKACLERCAEAGVPLVLLDRPNPLGRAAFGAGVAPGFASFVSAHNVRFVHGLTLGELATHVARASGLEHTLRVVPVASYRGLPWPETGLPWRAPSPNLPRLASARLYPVTVFLEGTNVSEGRGTDAPFEQIGAPWLDGEALAGSLNEQLPGLRAEPVRFTPGSSKYAGRPVAGVRLSQVSPFNPLWAARLLLREVRRQGGDRFAWLGGERPFVDLLAGSDVLRQAVDENLSDTDFSAWLETGEGLDGARVRLYPQGHEDDVTPQRPCCD